MELTNLELPTLMELMGSLNGNTLQRMALIVAEYHPVTHSIIDQILQIKLGHTGCIRMSPAHILMVFVLP